MRHREKGSLETFYLVESLERLSSQEGFYPLIEEAAHGNIDKVRWVHDDRNVMLTAQCLDPALWPDGHISGNAPP